MSQKLKDNEKELIKLVNFFKRRADKLILEGKLSEEHKEIIAACEKLIEALQAHATNREEVLTQQNFLTTFIKDNAHCPKCHKNTHLRFVGTEKNEQGWKCNKYRCRRCNIEFVWNRPNNPWDMIPFIESSIQEMDLKLQSETEEETKQQFADMIAQMQESLDKLKPVIQTFDSNYKELQVRDLEIGKMVHQFKNQLLIEKIKMDSWNENDVGKFS